MAWVDLALLAIMAVSVVIGLVRGFVFEVMSWAGWVVAYFAAHWFSDLLAPQLPIGLPGSSVNQVAAFVLTFIAALLIWAVVSRVIRMLVHATPLSVVDRLLGALFGALRGLLVLLVLATVVSVTPWAKSSAWQASVAAPWLHAALAGLKPVLPDSFSKHLPA